MLLPILIFRPDGKKYVEYLAQSTSQLSFVRQLGRIVNIIITRLYYLLIANTPLKIYYLSPATIYHPQSPSDYTSNYVFACNKHKDPKSFGQMSLEEKQQLLEQLKADYREILINYFITDKTLKDRIDKFINALFYANIPVPQIIEMHMELIDEFSTQLRLEGRSDETLLDYRLTLIDILAHLCEVYRCAIAKTN
jgi:circadian clock protein KaiA